MPHVKWGIRGRRARGKLNDRAANLQRARPDAGGQDEAPSVSAPPSGDIPQPRQLRELRQGFTGNIAATLGWKGLRTVSGCFKVYGAHG